MPRTKTKTHETKRVERPYRLVASTDRADVWRYDRPDGTVWRVSYTAGGVWHHIRCADRAEAEMKAGQI
jgi:hypothetical protein